MVKRRFLFLLLASILLLLPVTSYYAVSWEDIKNEVVKAVSAVDKDTIKKYIPGAAVALGLAAGGLYYYLTSAKNEKEKVIPFTVPGTESTEENVDVSLIVPQDNSRPIPKQYDVYSQTNADGGGPASCGYHALLRGMQVIDAKAKNMSDDELNSTLFNRVPIVKYFNFEFPLGIWREEIIERRREFAILKILRDKLNAALRKESLIENYDEKIKGIYALIIRDINIEVLDAFKKYGGLGDYRDYEFPKDEMMKIFQKGYASIADEKLAETVKNEATINTYLDLTTIVKELSTIKLPTINDQRNGDWLDDGELEFLWNKQQQLRPQGKGIIANDIDCGFSPIADCSMIGEKGTIDIMQNGIKIGEKMVDLDTVIPSLKEKLIEKQRSQKNYFYLLTLSTAKHARTGEVITGTSGHWYSLVIHQNKDGDRNYYVMDSFDNKKRRQDQDVQKIIDLIES